MIKRLNKNFVFLYSIITVILAVFIVVGVVLAWTEPTAGPPGGNVYAPLNISINPQAKDGVLVVGAHQDAMESIPASFIVRYGKVGIGIDAPSQKLDVDGQIHATEDICTDADGGACLSAVGAGSISGSGTQDYIPIWTGTNSLDDSPFTVNTSAPTPYVNFGNYKFTNVKEIDPIFNIWGKKYTSYMPDFIGQKVEVVGQEKLEGNELVINLAEEPEGSDLWLFWQVVDHESVIPFVSPQDNASLYAYIDGSRFVIKLRQGERDSRFSYRLIGTRLDHADDINNLYNDQAVEHFIDIDKLRK